MLEAAHPFLCFSIFIIVTAGQPYVRFSPVFYWEHKLCEIHRLLVLTLIKWWQFFCLCLKNGVKAPVE